MVGEKWNSPCAYIQSTRPKNFVVIHAVVLVFEETTVDIPSTQSFMDRCCLFIHIRIQVSTAKRSSRNCSNLYKNANWFPATSIGIT